MPPATAGGVAFATAAAFDDNISAVGQSSCQALCFMIL